MLKRELWVNTAHLSGDDGMPSLDYFGQCIELDQAALSSRDGIRQVTEAMHLDFGQIKSMIEPKFERNSFLCWRKELYIAGIWSVVISTILFVYNLAKMDGDFFTAVRMNLVEVGISKWKSLFFSRAWYKCWILIICRWRHQTCPRWCLLSNQLVAHDEGIIPATTSDKLAGRIDDWWRAQMDEKRTRCFIKFPGAAADWGRRRQ